MEYSFREPLAELASGLEKSGAVTINLPEPRHHEDFVDGRLTWGEKEFRVYFERSLGYLNLSSSRASDVETLATLLQSMGAE